MISLHLWPVSQKTRCGPRGQYVVRGLMLVVSPCSRAIGLCTQLWPHGHVCVCRLVSFACHLLPLEP